MDPHDDPLQDLIRSFLQSKNAYVMDRVDVSYLDKLLLDENGLLKVVYAIDLMRVPQEHLMQWGNQHGVYTFPTLEMIEWLKDQIRGRSAIEICAGYGAIGRALGIPTTDSYIQTTPEMIALYTKMGQVPIQPPPDVEKLEASEAVEKYKPQVVIAAYATQKYQEGDEGGEGRPKVNSSVYGVDELSILPKLEKYINIGNVLSHGDKRILKQFPNFKRYRVPWLFTRSGSPGGNEIVVWGD